jgi:hypothetical protein
MIEQVLQQTTATTAAVDLSWVPTAVQIIGAISGISAIIALFRFWASRPRLKIELVYAVRYEPEWLDVAFRVRNTSRRSTSIEKVYQEWGKWGRFFYRLSNALQKRVPRSQDLVLMEYGTLMLHERKNKMLRFGGTPVSFPLRISGDTTRNFHVQLIRKDFKEKHYLVIATTHTTYVKHLDPRLLGEDFVGSGLHD